MKNAIKAFVGLLAISANLTAQEITFTETEYNFGTINEKDGRVFHDFIFTNTGNKPLVLNKVITGCGCTAAQWEKRTYQPGEKGTVRITYKTEGRKMESFSIPTEVFTNMKAPATLTVTGRVELTRHPSINFFNPAKGKKVTYVAHQAKDDYEVILQHVREQMYESTTPEKMDHSATQLLRLLSPEGTWSDIDYECFFRTNWEPVDHLKRIEQLALAYTCPASSLYGNSVLYQGIEKAARVWNQYSPKSFNWWFNDISAPQAMGEILALMDAGVEKLPQDVTEGFMKMMQKSDPRKKTGANKMDIARHHLLRGCVLKNDSIVKANVDEFFQPVRISDYEGIMEDLSYQQHGKQLYIGGYGTVFVDNIALVAPWFVNTSFALSKEKVQILSDFIRKAYMNVFRSRYYDFSVCGRSISRVDILDGGLNKDLFKCMKALDPEHASEYVQAAQRFSTLDATLGRTGSNRMFYKSDYMLHNRKNYDFSVRAVSNRTCRSESGNGENLFGTFVSEGATNIRTTGDEYLNIFPVWEWDKIPGTTTPTGELENHYEWGVAGVAEFVGGVSDGLYGVMAYAMNDYGMKANKGWFMFDNEIVCLGAGISGGNGKEIHTSVNQCHLKGEVSKTVKGKAAVIGAKKNLDEEFKGFVYHDHVGYYFPESVRLNLKQSTQSGKWSRINFNQPGKDVSLPVFNMWMSHGKNPDNEKYVYFILPGLEDAKQLKQYDTTQITVEANTAQMQAVSHKSLNITQAIFYQAGELKCKDFTLQAKKPCVVMVKNTHTGQPEILVADPTQKEKLVVNKDVMLIMKK